MGELRYRPDEPDEPEKPSGDRPDPEERAGREREPSAVAALSDLELDDTDSVEADPGSDGDRAETSDRPDEQPRLDQPRGLPRPEREPPDDVVPVDETQPREERPAPAEAGQRPPDTAEPDERSPERVDRPGFRRPYDSDAPAPDRYGEPLREGTETPLFDGGTEREQTRQGDLGDQGVIATVGAVAGHRPDAIHDRIRETADGSYEVLLDEAAYSTENSRFEPTGRQIVLTVTPDLPVYEKEPGRPAFADSVTTRTAWAPILEKALAGADQTWRPERRSDWRRDWAAQAEYENLPEDPLPAGYVRLDMGTTPWDRAELLTQLTGEPAEVRGFPATDDALVTELRECLDDGKPVLVGTRALEPDELRLPHKLVDCHPYEVTHIDDEGKIHMRNPWNMWHPEPMTVLQFTENVRPRYTTLGGR